MGKRLNTTEFIQECQKIFTNYDYSKTIFTKLKDKIIVICPKHGEFLISAEHHLKRHQGCPKCAGKNLTLEEQLNRFRDIHGDTYNYELVKFDKIKDKIDIICPIHGVFTMTADHHLRGEGCPKCRNIQNGLNHRLSQEDFINRCNKIHCNKYDYSKVVYKTRQDNITIICPIHGEFLQKATHHLQGSGCPKCKLKSQNILYQKLLNTFPDCKIGFEVSKKEVPWLNLTRIDIYFYEYNIAVEYNGEQHYYPIEYFGGEEKFELQQQRDEIKRHLYESNNCKLFELKYNYSDQDLENLINNIKNEIELRKSIQCSKE